jgi:cyclophilin family peptidyl-prolyl cis-trans isomerase
MSKLFLPLCLLVLTGCPPKTTETTETTAMTKATIKTSMGTIEIELDRAKAPVSVDNFVQYAKAGHYDGTIFHRVIAGFMIQGGGFDAAMSKKSTRAPIKNEASNGLKNTTGTIAMARTSDPDSATAQFFINVKDNVALDRTGNSAGYAVFGRVTSGMDVVHKIEQVATGVTNGMKDVPVQQVTIESVRVE